MSRIEEMIRELCPKGVEYKKLKNTTTIMRGVRVVKSQLQSIGSYPVCQNSLTPMGYYDKYNCSANTTFIIGAGSAGEIGYSSVDFWAADDCFFFVCPDNLQSRFLYFVLLSQQNIIRSQVRKASIPRLGRAIIENIEIPVPPLAIQNEIVNILDKFTALTAELQAELQARRMQYEYYRNQLLTFAPDAPAVKWLPMNDVFEFRNGYTPSKAKPEYWTNGTIPWFRMDDIRTNGRILEDSIQHITPEAVKGGRLFPANSIILATTATIGEHALIIADSLANQRFTNLSIRKSHANDLDIKFFFYYMFIVDEWCKNNTNISGFASVDMVKLKKLLIPIPPLAAQERIVAILDKFESLVNDISEGLPAELAARQQQYEYYRDKLLTFPRYKNCDE